jgi:glutaredoxin
MNATLKNLLLLIGVCAVGLLAGQGAQRALAHYQGQSQAVQTGDYSALIPRGEAPVLLFTTATCSWCKKAKAYLDERGIAYRDVDVTTPEGNALFRQQQGSAVPLLMTASVRLEGYVEPEYDRHLQPLARG